MVAIRGGLTKTLALRTGARLRLLLLILVEGAKHIATPNMDTKSHFFDVGSRC